MADPDPRGELKNVQASLAGGAPLSGYALRGAERFFRDQAVALIKEAARAASQELCLHDAREQDFEAPALHDDLMGSGLFASARCIVIQNPEDLVKKVAGKDSGTTKAIKSFLAGGRGTLVLSAKSLRADAVVVKAIKAAGGLVAGFRPLYDSPAPWDRNQDLRATELVGWLRQRAVELDVPLSVERAVLLASSRGNDLGALTSALAEIQAGANDEDLRAAGEATLSPFKVAESVLKGAPSGPAELEQLFRTGMRKDKDGTSERSPDALVAIVTGTLRNKVRQGLSARSALDSGLGPKEALAVAGFGGPPAARDAFGGLVEARNVRVWQRMLGDIVALERRTRSSAPVDVSDLTRLALGWQPRRPARPTNSGSRR